MEAAGRGGPRERGREGSFPTSQVARRRSFLRTRRGSTSRSSCPTLAVAAAGSAPAARSLRRRLRPLRPPQHSRHIPFWHQKQVPTAGLSSCRAHCMLPTSSASAARSGERTRACDLAHRHRAPAAGQALEPTRTLGLSGVHWALPPCGSSARPKALRHHLGDAPPRSPFARAATRRDPSTEGRL